MVILVYEDAGFAAGSFFAANKKIFFASDQHPL
jgi:hypothetical protein